MEKNQNTDEQGQPATGPASEMNEHSERISSPTIITSSETNEKTPPLSTQPQTDSMEVHKHPHHVMHKKKWNEYLLEFFMLFLAVFLGFIAENMREKISEHEREKKYAEHLLLDLRRDSTVFQNRNNEFLERQKDQAIFFKTLSATPRPSDSIVYTKFVTLLRTWSPQFTTATYNQMKTSGSLRYIRNDQLTTEVQKYYDVYLPEIERQVTDVNKVFTDLILPYMVKHFRFQDLTDSIPTRYELLNRTPESDQELINVMGAYGAGWDVISGLHQKSMMQALTLIQMIRKEYHLE